MSIKFEQMAFGDDGAVRPVAAFELGYDGQLYDVTLADQRDLALPFCPSRVGQRATVDGHDAEVVAIDHERGVITFRNVP